MLRSVVRPLFSRTQPNPSLTPEGRKRIVPKARDQPLFSEEEAQKPWKRDPFVFPVLQWAIDSLHPSSVESTWPLLVPPVLALIDDHEIKFKTIGCTLLQRLLARASPNFLKRTGLAGVFEEAVTPCLSYLPSLTPAEESVRMLDAAYPCLIQLARTQFPAESREQDPVAWDAKIKKTTKLIRHGVLHGMMLAGEYPPVATCLLSQLSTLLAEEGIDSVRHLKDVVPLLSGILCDPFGLSHPPLLLAATLAFQSVVVNGWARMHVWKGAIIKGPCLLWIRIVEEERDEDATFEEVQSELKKTMVMLNAALMRSEEANLIDDVGILIDADDRVAGLLQDLKPIK